MKFIPYGKQNINKFDKKLVLDSLSNDLITTGPLVKNFEKEINKFLKCKHSFVCNSGTSAIHLALLSVGLKKGDIILMPAINFIASYNMAKIIGLKVYLVDVDKYTGQVTPTKVIECIKKNKLKKIKALLIMFNGGYPENIIEFKKIKKKYNFYIIEDACHAFGAGYKIKKKFYRVGSCNHSDVSTFSLHPLKTITTGEGGIVTTNISKIAKNIQLFRNHGIIRKNKKHWQYDVSKNGFNYRLSDINCALGASQLKRINLFLRRRKKIYNNYVKELKYLNLNLKIIKYSKDIKPSFHLFIINIDFKKIKSNKSDFIKFLLANKIIVQQHYIPIYKFTVYSERKNLFPDAENYFDNSISLPIFVNLSIKEQKKIIKTIKKYFIRLPKI